ncbi:biotin--[acetyl-CoA-carboxylase] ligase [Paenibacillus thiaminolyticus]|uniref:Bifunctional ligase/repressor BirA n=1 Tax=Paenibacillus thiaminolyticus TaxID=49283 RepID=A0AAP9DRZ0_PANTH|nr:biotin--[acetyl-CoA-carboxylase] ligase [Paenibacillus thiaminolyticus]MCY9538648.1 biotin--[acetyl-CoA-carboxylase] ligase [Paenibacillus thiaminolyticus]MCY9602431.1 biotin--[acetyl-CoA-carboxylase] ligase [Paenibacillus thiaminolyticus]MCY9610869.1 biotin--[acetyl-CoA-carboxylase] ligase [Paenibacillus thiaminolyticus]MCY9613300.1 biotin--[acetyl-CoA-carboxylase] ligase [Paenibacillus thiaminolyticus]MCY9619474.1 biotin--[acetyl-CoA-carboxylase] ligase [Paenibacillus thiaminolyticus]
MNQQLLDWFREHPGQYISGEELSRRLQITRTAVWKQINVLRAKGYAFDAVPKLGYRLVAQPTRLDEAALLSKLAPGNFGNRLRIVEKTESTQNEAAAWAKEGVPEGAVVLAEEQTGGRGRQGHVWHSPAGKGIWMSIVLRPRIPLPYTPHLTLLGAVAMFRAMKKLTSAPLGIKWPNDILADGKKVAGILLESAAEDERLLYVIAGIGISVNLDAADFPEELQERATSLKIMTGREVDRASLVAACLQELEQLYRLYEEEGFAPIRTLWEAQSITLGRQVTIETPQGPLQGIAEGLDESGALLLRDKTGTVQKVFSGDVHFSG